MRDLFPAWRSSPEAFHIMAKPSGPACNLKCDYCFYLEKEVLFPAHERFRMSEETLEAYIRNTIFSFPIGQPIMFTWQGGEPTLLGISFYKQAIALQKKHGPDRQIVNSFQTNGVLIDDAWASFFSENKFLVGLSLDGPEEIHDQYRRDNAGRPTHERVMKALECLQRNNVDINILACVNRHSAKYPLEVYRFFKAHGVRYIQFAPIVERHPSVHYEKTGFSLDGPTADTSSINTEVTDWSVLPVDWGQFLNSVFDEWRRYDIGSTYVMNFEWTLAAFMNQPGVVCVHQKNCGRALIAEHNGDVYSCDHFTYPEYRLGNLNEDSLSAMVDSAQQRHFGKAKSDTLPRQCIGCKYLRGCWGGCPKHRFIQSEEGQPGLNYLCDGYKSYLGHVEPYIKVMADLIRHGRAPSEMMKMAIHVVRTTSKPCGGHSQ